MSYNMTPICISCGTHRYPYDECGYTINDKWTCYGCIIKSLTAKLKAAEEGLRKIKAMRVENLRQTCIDCDDGCNHGVPNDSICRAISETLRKIEEVGNET